MLLPIGIQEEPSFSEVLLYETQDICYMEIYLWQKLFAKVKISLNMSKELSLLTVCLVFHGYRKDEPQHFRPDKVDKPIYIPKYLNLWGYIHLYFMKIRGWPEM